jgi:hypothetical protein
MKRILVLVILLLTATTAWSQPLELRLSPESSTCQIGQSVSLQLRIKNLSSVEKSFSYVQPAFFYPTIHSDDVKANQVQAEVYDGPARMVKVTVLPGQVQTLPTAIFKVVSQPQKGPEASWVALPGNYQLEYQLTLDGPAGAKWDLKSNAVNLTVQP